MAIELNDGSRIAAPVIRQQRLGEVAYLAIVRPEQRDRLRKNLSSGAMEPIPNGTDRQGRPKVKQLATEHQLSLSGAAHHLLRLGAGLDPLLPLSCSPSTKSSDTHGD